MGATVSKSNQTVLVDSLTSIVNKVTTKYVNENSNKVNSEQKMYIDMSGSNIYCDISATQLSDVNISILSTNKNDAEVKMSNDIMAQITAALESKSDQSISGLNLGQMAVSIQDQEIQQQIRSMVSNSVDSTIKNVLSTQTDISQGIYFKATNSNILSDVCDFSQNNMIKMFSQQAAQNMVTSAIDNKLVTVVDDTVVAENKQSLTGVSLLGLIGGGVFGFIGLILILYIIYTVIKKKQDK
jgi:hypothetical protein